jgi:protein O-mannosyl-transferase
MARSEQEYTRQVLLICALLVAMTLVLYWPVLSFDFVNLDDDVYVTHNRHVQSGPSWEGIKWTLTNLEAGFWQPLVWLSHMLDCRLYGLNAGGHHSTSVLIHCASTVLLFLVLRGMTGVLWGSALVAALFAIHPLHVESVAWVSERKGILSGFFWILTMGAYSHYVRRPMFWRYLLVLCSFVLGLLSKPTIVTLPFALLLLDYWPLRRFETTRTVLDRLWMHAPMPARAPSIVLVAEKCPLIVLSVIAGAITWMAEQNVGAVQNTVSYPLGVRLANALVSYALYVRKMVWPADLAVFYPHFGMPPLWQVLACAVVLIAVTVCAWCLRKQAPYVMVGWFWYLGTLVPVIGLVQIGSHALADRYTYIPLVGLFIALAWGMKGIVAQWPDLKRSTLSIALVVMAVLLFSARAQVGTWENSVTLFDQALTVTGKNPLALNNMGAYYLDRHDCKTAVPYFIKAIKMKKDYAYPYRNLGVCAARANDQEGALYYFRQAILLDPRFIMARIDRGHYLMQVDRLEEAMEDFRQVLRINPDDEAAHTNLGAIFHRQIQFGEAEWHLSEALRVNPDNAEALNNLGVLRTAQGRADDAIVQFRKALALAPQNPVIDNNLKQALAMTVK